MKQSKNFVKRKIGDQIVIIAVGEATKRFNGMVTVNETGSFIWDQLQHDITEEQLTAAITAEYEVDAATAARDAAALLATLREIGAIE